MNTQEAMKQISALRDEAMAKLKEATKLADKTGVAFSFSPAYGMGGSYVPVDKRKDHWADDYQMDNGWVSSSVGC